jgi:hypothetical protein
VERSTRLLACSAGLGIWDDAKGVCGFIPGRRTSSVGVFLYVFAKSRLMRPTISGIGHKIKLVNNPDLRTLVHVEAKLILF